MSLNRFVEALKLGVTKVNENTNTYRIMIWLIISPKIIDSLESDKLLILAVYRTQPRIRKFVRFIVFSEKSFCNLESHVWFIHYVDKEQNRVLPHKTDSVNFLLSRNMNQVPLKMSRVLYPAMSSMTRDRIDAVVKMWSTSMPEVYGYANSKKSGRKWFKAGWRRHEFQPTFRWHSQ